MPLRPSALLLFLGLVLPAVADPPDNRENNRRRGLWRKCRQWLLCIWHRSLWCVCVRRMPVLPSSSSTRPVWAAWKEKRKTKISIQIANGSIQRIIINFYRVPFIISAVFFLFFWTFSLGWLVGLSGLAYRHCLAAGDTFRIFPHAFVVCRVLLYFGTRLAVCCRSNCNHVIQTGVCFHEGTNNMCWWMPKIGIRI